MRGTVLPKGLFHKQDQHAITPQQWAIAEQHGMDHCQGERKWRPVADFFRAGTRLSCDPCRENKTAKKPPKRKRPEVYIPRVHNRYHYNPRLQEQNSVVSMGDSPAAVAPAVSVGAGQETDAGPVVASPAADGAGQGNDAGPAVQRAPGPVTWQLASAQRAAANVGRAEIEDTQRAPSLPPPATSYIIPPHFEYAFPAIHISQQSLPPPPTNPYHPLHLYTSPMSYFPPITAPNMPIVPPKFGSNAKWGDGDSEVLIEKGGPNSVREPTKPAGLGAAPKNTANFFASGTDTGYIGTIDPSLVDVKPTLDPLRLLAGHGPTIADARAEGGDDSWIVYCYPSRIYLAIYMPAIARGATRLLCPNCSKIHMVCEGPREPDTCDLPGCLRRAYRKVGSHVLCAEHQGLGAQEHSEGDTADVAGTEPLTLAENRTHEHSLPMYEDSEDSDSNSDWDEIPATGEDGLRPDMFTLGSGRRVTLDPEMAGGMSVTPGDSGSPAHTRGNSDLEFTQLSVDAPRVGYSFGSSHGEYPQQVAEPTWFPDDLFAAIFQPEVEATSTEDYSAARKANPEKMKVENHNKAGDVSYEEMNSEGKIALIAQTLGGQVKKTSTEDYIDEAGDVSHEEMDSEGKLAFIAQIMGGQVKKKSTEDDISEVRPAKRMKVDNYNGIDDVSHQDKDIEA